MTVPDAWDECCACGHDRDDHSPMFCNMPIRHPDGLIGHCDCPGFKKAS